MTLSTSSIITFFFYMIFVVLILCSSSILTTASDSNKPEDEFSYTKGTEKGPENWGHINPQWKVCGDGKSQSPIDIQQKGVTLSPQLGKLQIHYKPASAVLKNRGHDIMLQWNGDAGSLSINGTEYKTVQCHWHTPSEHTLDGSKFDLELHVVHQSSMGERAVIGIWYKIGKPDPFLEKLIPKIKAIGENDVYVGAVNPKDIKFGTRKYYRYFGSLTTPPCSQGVTWTLVKKVRTVSAKQLTTLKAAVQHGFEVNARPTQKLGERQVWFYAEKAN